MAIKAEPHAEPIPGYRLIERLGGGGFGEVWKAEAPGGLFKAIKFVYGLLDSLDEDAARAEQELRALERIKLVRHSYILSLDRIDKVESQLLIVMELADQTLWDRFKECRNQGLLGIPRKELIGYLKEAAEALDFMYTDCQLLHLDIKPQNLFLIHNHIKVADFGLTKNMKDSAASITGGVTPVYAAPETFDGEGRRSTDQYSLAIVYQEMLTGQRPFTGTTARQLVLQHMQAEPDLASLSPEDQTVIRKALSKDYRDRFPTCIDFIRALEDITQEKSQPVRFTGSADIPQASPSAPTNGFSTKPNDEPDVPPGSPTMLARPSHQHGPLTPGRPTSQLLDQLSVSARALKKPLPEEEEELPLSRLGIPADTPNSMLPEELELAVRSGGIPPHLTQSTILPPYRAAPPQVSNDGVLVPALVIGIGFLGQFTLKQFRQQIHDAFGGTSHLAHIRTLYLDSDPDALTLAGRGGAAALQAQETVLTRLHRASYYLKPKDNTTTVHTWLPPRMLYRIPRQQTPAGVRALGRLAFVDNYESILRRLEMELQACRTNEALAIGHEKTGLPVFNTSPRVYVVTSIAGGTGSGMFIDVGYAVRALLKEAGFENPDVVAMLLLPQIEKKPAKSADLANTFAALTELQHFSQPGNTFSASYGCKDGRSNNNLFSTKEPPFRRCILVPCQDSKWPTQEEAAASGTCSSRTLRHAANLLFMELCTSLGREADRERQKWTEMQPKSATGSRERVIYQTADLVRIHWPYKQILHRTSIALCQRLVKHWMNKDAKPLRESVAQWVQKQWGELELSANQLIERLQETCKGMLGQEPGFLFNQILDPLTSRLVTQTPTNQKSGKPGSDAGEGILALGKVVEVLEEYEQYLGIPDGCQGPGNRPPCMTAPGRIAEILKEAVATLVSENEKRIAELVVRLIEQPEFRLAGAEETLRQFSNIVQRALENQEELNKELMERSILLYNRIHTLVENPEKNTEKESGWRLSFSRRSSSRQSLYAKELLETLRAYPKFRFQSLVLQNIHSFYVSLRGQLSDQLREVDFCRARLHEMEGKFQEAKDQAEKTGIPTDLSATGRWQLLLPEGCKNVENAIELNLNQVSVEDFFVLDHQIEKLIRKQFRALVHVCMASSSLLRTLVPKMLWETQCFLRERVNSADTVQMYLNKFQLQSQTGPQLNEPAVSQALLTAYESAEPRLLGTPDEDSLCILANPESPESEQLRRIARQALPRTRVQFAPSVDEIIIYREQLHSTLASLQQLARTARPAYEQMARQEHLTPHSRLDITNWTEINF